MRNLKKFLALVLAMVMAFSLMLSANAIDAGTYTDKDKVTEQFVEAVSVLSGLKIMEGDGAEDAKTFRPIDTITRAEAAAVLYRVVTGDVSSDQVGLYKDYGRFADVKADDWFAGYVNFCADRGIIKGDNATTFRPYGNVTGYEMLAMLLRAVGYGQENEFSGNDWRTTAMSRAEALHITDTVKEAHFNSTLNMAATREIVASLVFETMVQVPTVTHNTLGYSDRESLTSNYKNPTLGQKIFGLYCEGKWREVDKWGTPGYYWLKDGEHAVWTDSKGDRYYSYDKNQMPMYGPKNGVKKLASGLIDSAASTIIATITPKETKEYNTADIRECNVAHDLKFDGSEIFNLHVNSKESTTKTYTVQATDTVTPVGGQGRVTKFWYGVSSRFAGEMDNWCTMVDTYLAKVTGVSAPVLDKAGHVIVQAKLNLEVYDAAMSVGTWTNGVGTNNPLDSTNPTKDGKFPSKHVVSQDEEFEWSVGDMLLVKGYTDYSQNYDNQGNKDDYDDEKANNRSQNTTGLNHTINTADIEKTAYETNVLKADDKEAKISIDGKADMKLGKQAKTIWNVDQHDVDGTIYDDQMTLFLDRAKTDTTVTWAWYFDALGNLIGIDEAPSTTQYGVITSIYAAFNQGESYTDGTCKAIATVLMADGSTQTVTIDRFLVSGQAGAANGRTDLTAGTTTRLEDGNTTPIAASTAGSTELIPMYDYNAAAGDNVMKAEAISVGTAHNAKQKANLFMAPVASVNNLKENQKATNNWTSADSHDYFGIIRGNMFKFVNTQYGMTAVEVAGKYDTNHNTENTGIYEWLYHDLTDNTPKLVKTLGQLVVSNTKNLWVSNSTKIIVRSSDNSNVINVYDGLSNLPGDVDMTAGTEVDWVDFNGDGRVDYVYLTGRVKTTITYGLFYYNGGYGDWNGTTGTLNGWLNGEEKAITFTNEDLFNIVKNHTSVVEANNYRAHLFALQMMDGVVSDVMVTANNAGAYYLLSDTNTDTNKVTTNNKNTIGPFTADGTKTTQTAAIQNSFTTNRDMFGLGALSAGWGNTYSATTNAAYLKDSSADDVEYVPGRGVITQGADTYYLAESTKIIGIGRGVTYGENVLYYLNECDNDVTIIYDTLTGSNVILEIYVATDPDWTPDEVKTGAYIGDDITKAPAGMNQAQLLTWLKGFNGGVFWCDYVKATSSAAGMNNLIYFPFVAGGSSVTLTIRDDSGLRWSENHSTTSGTAYVLDFDFLNAPASAGSWLGGKGLTAGTYTYNIDSGTTHITGTFTLIAK